MNQREKFEAWAAEQWGDTASFGMKHGQYEHMGIRNHWDAWEAALAASGGNAAPELPEPLEIHWPTLNSNALGCGVEDRGLHDRYECAEYGWQDGVDMAASCVPDAIYDADQMREYGKACAAASAPNAALVAVLKKVRDYHVNHHVLHEIDAALSAAGQEVGK